MVNKLIVGMVASLPAEQPRRCPWVWQIGSVGLRLDDCPLVPSAYSEWRNSLTKAVANYPLRAAAESVRTPGEVSDAES